MKFPPRVSRLLTSMPFNGTLLATCAAAAVAFAAAICDSAPAADPPSGVPSGKPSANASPVGASSTAPVFSAADLDFYERKIRPLLARRCYKCHSAQAKTPKSGLRLDSLSEVRAGGDSGPLLDAAAPEKGLLAAAVQYSSDLVQMPPAGKLPDREIALLVEWARRGAPMPHDGPAPNGGPSSARGGIDFAAAREFWSFQPLRRHPLPAVRDRAWPAQPIDRFVLAKLEAQGLTPSADADRRTLIRRATFDLLGLPPTWEEIEAFAADDRPDAYARLIDRLLASPHYGERWGRYWLDVVRYVDTTASWLGGTPNSWLYRDWVVRAVNDDMPYDEFVKRQLATDQMPETGPEDTPALGLLGLSPTYWKELRLAPDVIETIVADEWEERIDLVGRGLLGLTLACARCHDHKFDPIGTEDYYALAGVFASTRLIDRPIIEAQLAEAAAKARGEVAALEPKLSALKQKRDMDEGVLRQIDELTADIERLRATPHFDTPLAHAVDDAALFVSPDGEDKTKLVYKPGEARDLPMHIRGNAANPGRVVPRHFLRVLSSDPPPRFTHGSGRLDLAEAIFHEGRPLAARVIVNRVWMQHFGRGLVDTPSNFGRQGSRPTHPELLDDLAARFVASGWSLKWLHREIMLSSAYRQSSDFDAGKFAADPDNRLLWRFGRRRLDVEAWRDAMLAVSGALDLTIGGPPAEFDDPANHRRTMYGRVDRRNVPMMLRLYDFPAPEAHSPKRDPTTTPLQQLFVLNSDFLRQRAEALADRARRESASSDEARIARMVQFAFGRAPTSREVSMARRFLSATPARGASDEPWIEYAHALLASNEFLFVD